MLLNAIEQYSAYTESTYKNKRRQLLLQCVQTINKADRVKQNMFEGTDKSTLGFPNKVLWANSRNVFLDIKN